MAESKVLNVYELKNLFLQDNSALAFNDLDGVGKSSFWIVLDKAQVVVASFGWSVKPGATPQLKTAVLVANGSATEIKANLRYDLRSVTGSISVLDKTYVLDAKKSEMRSIDVWQRSSRTYDFSDLEKLIGNTPIKILKPKQPK